LVDSQSRDECQSSAGKNDFGSPPCQSQNRRAGSGPTIRTPMQPPAGSIRIQRFLRMNAILPWKWQNNRKAPVSQKPMEWIPRGEPRSEAYLRACPSTVRPHSMAFFHSVDVIHIPNHQQNIMAVNDFMRAGIEAELSLLVRNSHHQQIELIFDF